MSPSVLTVSLGLAAAALIGTSAHPDGGTSPAASGTPRLVDANCAGYCVNDWNNDWRHYRHHHDDDDQDRVNYNDYDYTYNHYNSGIEVYNGR